MTVQQYKDWSNKLVDIYTMTLLMDHTGSVLSFIFINRARAGGGIFLGLSFPLQAYKVMTCHILMRQIWDVLCRLRNTSSHIYSKTERGNGDNKQPIRRADSSLAWGWGSPLGIGPGNDAFSLMDK